MSATVAWFTALLRALRKTRGLRHMSPVAEDGGGARSGRGTMKDWAQDVDMDAKAFKGLEQLAVTSVRHWTDRLFSFDLERPASLRFRSGEFVMIGLPVDGKPLLRAYSITSPAWDEKLSFYSIKVQDGPLTSRLQHIEAGDKVLVRPRPTGTLVLDALRPGKRLIMISTGTGIAPFASVARDPDAYEKFERVIVTHSCRWVDELAYGLALRDEILNDPLIGEMAAGRFQHFASATREAYAHQGRITELIESGALFEEIEGGPLDPETDRIMICGSAAMLADVKALCLARGFEEGANNKPADFVIEKAFVG